MHFGISSIPFVALFRGGRMVANAVGFMPERAMRDALGL
jgi:thioredoxin-like negative regulator of GroEL